MSGLVFLNEGHLWFVQHPQAALTDGLEWNVKISQHEIPHLWANYKGQAIEYAAPVRHPKLCETDLSAFAVLCILLSCLTANALEPANPNLTLKQRRS